MNATFLKMSALSSEDRSKIKGYWSPLWGSEFAKALTMDYETSGNKKKVEASSVANKKKM